MTDSNSTSLARRRKPRPTKKPSKPYPDFPLFPHATKRWAKKIRGKLHYFGSWADWRAALERYTAQKDALHAGLSPRMQTDAFTVRDLLNRFMTAKRHLVDTRELARVSFADYLAACTRVGKCFGLERLVVDLAVDDGPAAGQTVMHAHVHIIPRRQGDTADPRGGVRRIFPGKAQYWGEGHG